MLFAEEFVVVDPDSALWSVARPLLNAALNLEHQDAHYRWQGWQKEEIAAFLQKLPPHCTLMAGVWNTEDEVEQREALVLGLLCEVVEGAIRSLRTFEALADSRLPAISALEPGFEHARELLRAAKQQVAPVAWAIFTDQTTWQEWMTTESSSGQGGSKGELLATLASQGRCVLMGSQVMHYHIER